jgi:hypothetical protein
VLSTSSLLVEVGVRQEMVLAVVEQEGLEQVQVYLLLLVRPIPLLLEQAARVAKTILFLTLVHKDVVQFLVTHLLLLLLLVEAVAQAVA